MRIPKHLWLIAALFLFLSNALQAQQDWNAQWIYSTQAPLQEEAVVLFRRTFPLAQQPQRYLVHLSADNHYRLFVNGRYITRGPARGDLAHWFYESLDLAPYLVVGDNTLAIEVVNWGPKRSFTQFSQMTSLWVQGDSPAEAAVNTASNTWKCYYNQAHHYLPVDWIFDKKSIAFGLYVASPTDSINGNTYPWSWQNKDYDDAHWQQPMWMGEGGPRGTQHAGGVFFPFGKLLVPRRTGLLVEQPESMGKLLQATDIAGPMGFLEGKRTTVPAHTTVTLLLDHEVLAMGYPNLLVSGGKNAKIAARYAETMFIDAHHKGNRNEWQDKNFIGIRDVFVPDGGANRTFAPSFYRAFRFVQLTIQTDKEPLHLEAYFNMTCHAPIEQKARFETDDPSLAPLVDMGWRTASLCAQDVLLSDAYYEQMQYVGDSRVHNLTLLTLSGNDRLTRNALIQFDQSRIPEGLTYACYPNPFHLIIPSYSLIFVDQVHDYMMWNDDRAFVAQFDLGIWNVLDWFEQRIGPDGLLGPIEWWPALAWPKGYVNGVPPEMDKPGNALYSLHYVYSLQHAAEVYRFIGQKEKAKICEKRAERTRKAVVTHCFDAQKGLFKESPTLEQYGQVTNILAVLANAVKGQQAQSVMEKCLRDTTLTGKADLFLHLYLFEALNKTGLGRHFFDEISEWRTMQQRGLTTFVEVPLEWGEENQRSECHPWSTIPNVHFFRTVCGIRATAPGHSQIEVMPELGHLKTLKATYPHPKGNIDMVVRLENGRLLGKIVLPKGMAGKFAWGKQKMVLKAGENVLD
jgi:alpha-L-rhamnosidase